ncbi:MAG TPA: hypothetical protein VMU99_01335 [Acidimicrobiales bacterium]|nr:hypothetical protein [Acidimicrobiales bacterium]
MTLKTPTTTEPGESSSRQWVSDHIGRMLGVLLGLIGVVVLALFASLGFHPALYILVFIGAGFVLIVGGGMIHRA